MKKVILGAIIFALFLCLILGMADARDRKLFAEIETREYIEMMGERYGTDIRF